jgi:hypothetical protein
MAIGLPDSIMSVLSQTRKVTFTLSYKGQDITPQIANCLIDLVYRESFKLNVQADTLDIKIADPEGLFRQTFTLDAYSEVVCTINIENWNGPFSGTASKTLSTMYIKSIRIDQEKHIGTCIKLGCTSIPPQSKFRLEKKSASYGNSDTPTTLKDTAQSIATEDGMKLQYLASKNPTIQRVDIHDHSDAYALQKLCSDNDFQYKVVNNTIYIRDMKDVESLSPIGTIVCPTRLAEGGLNNQGVLKWEYTETLEDIYGSCTASVTDPTTGKTVSESTTDPNQPATAPKLVHHKYLYSDGTAYDHITMEGTTDQTDTQSGN